MTDRRLHNDCDGGFCIACRSDEIVARGRICETCYWWLQDPLCDGICRRFRPSSIQTTASGHTCGFHSFDPPARPTTQESQR